MNDSMEEALKKINELLAKQENEREKALKEIRSELLKFNSPLGEGEEEKNQQADTETDSEHSESIDPKSEPEEILPEEPLLIAVSGAKKRVGTTHCAVSIANYLVRNGKRTAVMEFNTSGELAAMGRYFDQTSEEEFYYKDVKYYAECTLQQLDQAAASGKYDFLVLDLGNYTAEKTLFSRSDLKFMVSGGKPWELEGLFPIFHEINKKILLQTYFIFNFVPENGKEAIAAGMGNLGQVLFTSFIEDPFKEMDEHIEEVLKEYIEHEGDEIATVMEKPRKTAKSLFRREQNEKSKERGKRKNNLVQTVPATE